MRSSTLGDVIAAKDTVGPGPPPKGTREEKKFAKLAHKPTNHENWKPGGYGRLGTK